MPKRRTRISVNSSCNYHTCFIPFSGFQWLMGLSPNSLIELYDLCTIWLLLTSLRFTLQLRGHFFREAHPDPSVWVRVSSSDVLPETWNFLAHHCLLDCISFEKISCDPSVSLKVHPIAHDQYFKQRNRT